MKGSRYFPIALAIVGILAVNCTASEKKDNRPMKMIDVSQLKKSAAMMDEGKYWNLVGDSLKNTSNREEQESYLIAKLAQSTPEEIIGFRLRTDKLLYDSYQGDLWCAAYIMNGGCSDDGFEYFRNWLISRGKDVFSRAIRNPDSLVGETGGDMDEYEFESFWYVAPEAFKQTTGKDLYDYIDYDQFKTREGSYPGIKFNWKEDDPESMRAICPRLFAKFNG